ncbi:hypothetical protein PanWU01x14_144950 [Parasponia andersonii]|uniref:Uncharacterized protein n=1 Tax=Parasponia andersonii TaxID=3476 RepID=A0A2P5CKL9_PARAD|nr:hypothetical protein PanWU01x14_144950 [Parasponia andersonii]
MSRSVETAEAEMLSSKDDITGVGFIVLNLEDLFTASMKFLGKGGIGTLYKAVLEQSIVVIVKEEWFLLELFTSNSKDDTSKLLYSSPWH